MIKHHFFTVYMHNTTKSAIFVQYETTEDFYWFMKKEFGKWLMDIAKYMVTALLLSSTFGNMNNPLIVACVVVASASTLGAGLWLIGNTEKKES